MSGELQKVYDQLFERAASIVATGKEHQMFAMTFAPSANGYELHGVAMLAGEKDGVASVLSGIVRSAPEMWLVVHISEAWRTLIEPGEEWDDTRPVAEHPKAYEVVTFTFFREGEVHMAECRIRRPENVLEKAHLEKMKVGDLAGRFIPVHVR